MSQGASSDSREWGPAIARITFLCLTLALLGTAVYTLRSVIHAIILGILFAILLMPLYRFNLRHVERALRRIRLRRSPRQSLSFAAQTRLLRRIDSRNRSIASALTVALVFVVVVVPISMLTFSFGKQGFQATVSAQHWLVNEFPGKVQEVIEKYSLREKLGQFEGIYQRVSGATGHETGIVDLASSAEQDEEVIVPLSTLSGEDNGSDEAVCHAVPLIKTVSEESLRDDVSTSVPSSGRDGGTAGCNELSELSDASPLAGQADASETSAPLEAQGVSSEVTSSASYSEVSDDGPHHASSASPARGEHEVQNGTLGKAVKAPVSDFDTQIGVWVSYVVNRVLEIVQASLGVILSRIWVLIFNFCIMLFVMYQIFYDGENIGTYIRSISPLGDNELRWVTIRLKQVTRAIFYGIFGTAVVQGAFSMLVFKFVDIPVFWGVLLGLSSIVPVVGTSLIWVPVTLYLILIDAYGKALIVFLFCGCLVANLDMLLRPLLMKKSGETGLSYMVLFLSILGGIQSFGVVGVIYGPLIAGLCSICLLLFSVQFKGVKDSHGSDRKDTLEGLSELEEKPTSD